jgi:hypothetical protein
MNHQHNICPTEHWLKMIMDRCCTVFQRAHQSYKFLQIWVSALFLLGSVGQRAHVSQERTQAALWYLIRGHNNLGPSRGTASLQTKSPAVSHSCQPGRRGRSRSIILFPASYLVIWSFYACSSDVEIGVFSVAIIGSSNLDFNSC